MKKRKKHNALSSLTIPLLNFTLSITVLRAYQQHSCRKTLILYTCFFSLFIEQFLLPFFYLHNSSKHSIILPTLVYQSNMTHVADTNKFTCQVNAKMGIFFLFSFLFFSRSFLGIQSSTFQRKFVWLTYRRADRLSTKRQPKMKNNPKSKTHNQTILL